MRILQITPTYWPATRYGGPIRSVHDLCRGLADLGHEVSVLTTNVDGPGTSAVPLDRAVDQDGVSVRYFATGIGRRLYRSPAMGRALQAAMTEADIVHIHAVFLWPGWAAARTARRHSVPYLVSPRGMLVPELIAGRSTLVKRAWIRLVERRTLAAAAAIHVTASAESRAIQALGLDLAPLLEVPNGIELPLLSKGGEPMASSWQGIPPGRRLLYLGRISWKKGLDRLVGALADVPDAVLLLAGNDEEKLMPELGRTAQALGVADRVRFVGPVEGAGKWSLLREADVLVLPSLHENFGIVVAEALAVGTPVVVTREVGAAELVGTHGAGLVVEGVPQELAAGIAELLRDPARRRAMGERGARAIREYYSTGAVAHRMEAAYARLIANRTRQPLTDRHGAAA